MPAEIVRAVFEVVLQVVLEFVVYWFGRITVAVFTLGCVRCDFYERETTWSSGCRIGGRDADGIYLSAEATTVIGLLPMIAIVICIAHFR